MGIIKKIALLVLAANQTHAQTNNVQVPAQENIISCSALNIGMSHQIYSVSGQMKGRISFPVYLAPYSPERLKEKQEEFANWDGLPPVPADERKLAVTAPLLSSNQFSSDKEKINKRAEFFNSLFPQLERTEFVSVEYGSLDLNFLDINCEKVEENGLISINCIDTTRRELNNNSISRMLFHMSNQRTEEFVVNADGVPEVKTTNSVYTSLEIISNNERYISEFTYKPDGERTACSLNDENLPAFIN